MPRGVPKTKMAPLPATEKPKEFVSVEDFNKLVGSVTKLAEMLKADKEPKQVAAPVVTPSVMATMPEPIPLEKPAEPDRDFMSPKWREVVTKYLGEDFGLRVSYPDGGSGLIFKVIVPKEKSNASEAQWKLYKSDVRSIAVRYSDANSGLENWCKKIAQNLKLKPIK